MEPAGVTFSNFQYLVCEVDENIFGLSRDSLIAVLRAENVNARRYFYPGTHRTIGYAQDSAASENNLPVTDHLCATCIQLPIGAMVEIDDVYVICEIIGRSQREAAFLKPYLADA